MSEAQVMEKAVVVNGVSIEHTRAARLLMLEAQMEVARSRVTELRVEFVRELPEATGEQFAVVVAAAQKDTEIPEGWRPNVDFRLTESQKVAVKKAKEDREAHVAANKAALVTPLLGDATQKLVAFTVRAGKNRTTTTARFVRSNVAASAESRGLLAQLAKVVK